MSPSPDKDTAFVWDSAEVSRALTLPWVLLFGGRGRQGICKALIESGIEIGQVLHPKGLAETASDAVCDIQAMGVPMTSVSRKDFTQSLSKWSGHPVLSIGFPYIIETSVLDRHPICLNVHPTLLPKYKGPHSGAHVILNGETVAGSTVHVMSEVMDSGAIVLQRSVSLDRFDTVRSMQRKIYSIEPGLVLDAIDFLRRGGVPAPQRVEDETVYPGLRTPSDSVVDSSQPLDKLWNAIRACDPDSYPAHFFVEGEQVCIRLWRPNKSPHEYDMI